MSNRVVYVGTYPDGSKLMVERWLDDEGNELSVQAAVKPVPAVYGTTTWGPPMQLERED